MDLSSSALLTLEPNQATDLWLEKPEAWVAFHPYLAEVATVRHALQPDGSLEVERRWRGTMDAAPAVLRPFVTTEFCGWTETLTWVPGENVATWTRQASRSSWWTSSGTTRLTTGGSGLHKKTRWFVEASLAVDFKAFDPAPLFLRERLRGALEVFAKALGVPDASLEAAAFTQAIEQWAGESSDAQGPPVPADTNPDGKASSDGG